MRRFVALAILLAACAPAEAGAPAASEASPRRTAPLVPAVEAPLLDAPGGFRLDTARQSHPEAPDTDANEHVLEAAESCPVEAITITLLGSGEAVFPPDD